MRGRARDGVGRARRREKSVGVEAAVGIVAATRVLVSQATARSSRRVVVPDDVLAWWGTVRFPLRLAASVTGYAITIFVAWYLLQNHQGWAGRDVDLWTRVGAEARAGISPYRNSGTGLTYYYAPPWTLLFAATSWIGKPALWAVISTIEVLSLRYIAGSWLRVGYFGLCFLTGAEIVSGAFNLAVAAGLVAAMRGDSRLATFMGLAKLSPFLAIRDLRRPAIVIGACLLVTIPVLGWWADWVMTLARAPTDQASLGFYQIPLVARAVVAVAILSVWRSPRAGALAAAVAIPALYTISLVLLYAVVSPLPKPSSERDGGEERFGLRGVRRPFTRLTNHLRAA